MITRRRMFGMLAAPVIVRASSLMAVVPVPRLLPRYVGFAALNDPPTLTAASLEQMMIEIGEQFNPSTHLANRLLVRPTKLIIEPEWLDRGARLLATAHPESNAAPA